LAGLRYAGEALLGQNTPIGASSYTIGIPATLPTGGYAQLNGGVTARTFQTTTSVARLSAAALAGLAKGEVVTIPSLHEGEKWDAYEAQRQTLSGLFGHSTAAPRYR